MKKSLGIYEVFVLYTDPTTFDEDADFDNDGLTNSEEMILGSNPWLPDSDFDGIIDSKDENPTLTDANTGKDINYDVDIKVGKFDIVSQYVDLDGNINKNIYNYISGENKFTSQGDESVIYFYDKSGNVTTLITNTGKEQIANTYSYDNNNNLTAISHNDFRYDFEYDENDNLVHVGIGERALVGYSYDGNVPTSISYGNAAELEAVFDESDKLIAQKTNGITTYEWTYDENGNILTHRDVVEDITFTYDYNDENELASITASNGFAINYEQFEDIYEISYNLGGNIKTQTFESITEDKDEEEPEVIGSIVKLLSNGKLATIITDENTYTSTITLGEKKILETTYTMDDSLLSEIKYSDGSSISYSYDDKGNITEIYENNKLTESYTYDSLNQLVREDSAKSGTTTVYTYDNAGNILETKKYTYTEDKLGKLLEKNTYTYSDSEWKDLLTEYNGQAITYDEIGNPISYRDGYSFKWQNGRQLASLQNDGIEIKYTYDASGIRTSKTINGTKTDYKLNGSTIVAETTKDKTTWYDYDASGMPVGFTTEEASYYYKKNAQGDIVAILDSDGNEVAGYSYDAWGNITHISGDEEIAKLNPFRYRGYYQDDETGLFYVGSRYYDPEIGRFINADVPGSMILQGDSSILATNLFAYCFNNPVINSDHSGMVVTPANVIGAVVGGILGAVGGYFLSRWFADKLGLGGWKKTAFIIGVTALVSATSATIGYFIGPYIAKAWGTWSSRLAGLVRQSYSSIGKLTSQKLSHINVSKHLWGKVLSKVTNAGIESLIHQGIRHGTWTLSSNGSIQILWKHKGQIIEITGKVVDKIFKVGSAWVR